MRSRFGNSILNARSRIPMPIGVYAGLEITGASVKDAVTSAQRQAEAVLALHERFNTRAMLTAMDLSAEAEAFGCAIRMPEDEIPTVIGRRATNEAEIGALALPAPGAGRTSVHLQTAQKLVVAGTGVPVLGGLIGPFSLAGRIFGVSEALELSATDPERLEELLEKTTAFLLEYARAFRDLGVDGVIMAEPAAGLLSPRGLSRFSSAYVRRITDTLQTDHFSIVLHNCGAKMVHLPRVLEAGAEIYHFGAPMDIGQALAEVDGETILAGNLDPAGVFLNGTRAEVIAWTQELLQKTSGYPNFIASSGCDLPPHTPVANLDAFYETVGAFAG